MFVHFFGVFNIFIIDFDGNYIARTKIYLNFTTEVWSIIIAEFKN